MKYQIITDSCCDFTDQQYHDLGVTYAPLTVLFQGQARDNMNDPEELHRFYDGIRGGEMPTTSAVNPEGWVNIMKPILDVGEDVLCLAFSSGLSTTYQSAVIAAKEMEEVYPDRTIRVVDTLCAALGQGLLVYLACRKRDEGMGLEDLAAWVEDNKLNIAHWVTVDDLNHLKRGGRISATTAFFGGMLNIKPIIHVDNDGHLVNVAKARGRKASMDYLLNKVKEDCTDFENVFVAHGDCPEDAAILEKALKELGVKNVVTGYVGGVIGAHTGPGVLVIFFVGKQR